MSFAHSFANDITRAQINNIPSKSHVIPLKSHVIPLLSMYTCNRQRAFTTADVEVLLLALMSRGTAGSLYPLQTSRDLASLKASNNNGGPLATPGEVDTAQE